VKLHTKNSQPQNDKKKIEDFKTSKDLQTSQEEKKIPNFPPCETSHKIIKDPQNDKTKIEDFEISKYENKNPSKYTRRKAHTPK